MAQQLNRFTNITFLSALSVVTILLYPRIPGGRALRRVAVDGKEIHSFTRDAVVIPSPGRDAEMQVHAEVGPW